MQRIIEGYFGLLKILIVLCLAVMVVLVFGKWCSATALTAASRCPRNCPAGVSFG